MHGLPGGLGRLAPKALKKPPAAAEDDSIPREAASPRPRLRTSVFELRMSSLRILVQLLALAATLLAGIARAQAPSSPKVSADLRAVLAPSASAVATPVPWARQMSNQWYVKVLINASSTDPNLAALRADILVRGGSVFYNFLSVRALSALVPATALDALAARSDVIAIAPNRSTTRHASLLQQATGAATQLPLSAGGLAEPGLDGRGVGIAILDSGIDYRHRHTLDASGNTRVRAAVDVVKLGRDLFGNGWTLGRDWSPSLRVALDGSKFKHELKKLAPSSSNPDPYGHGSHVAAVAAGAGNYQSPESGGIAPAADLYDVRVLDERGVGNLADVLAGIDWTMQRARQANIRVVNLSLGASSTDSFLVDPLARATRSATAMGLVVVAAAGNAGRNAAGQTVYGTVSSPGHEPSVITVGAAASLALAKSPKKRRKMLASVPEPTAVAQLSMAPAKTGTPTSRGRAFRRHCRGGGWRRRRFR